MTTSENETPVEVQLVSNEELQAKADSVQKLREKVQELEAQRVSSEASLSNQIAMAQLETEEARLNARLAQARQAVEGGAVESSATPLATAKADMERAVEQQKAAEASERGEVYEPQVPADQTPVAPTNEQVTPTPPSVPGQTPVPAPTPDTQVVESGPPASPVTGAFTDSTSTPSDVEEETQ